MFPPISLRIYYLRFSFNLSKNVSSSLPGICFRLLASHCRNSVYSYITMELSLEKISSNETSEGDRNNDTEGSGSVASWAPFVSITSDCPVRSTSTSLTTGKDSCSLPDPMLPSTSSSQINHDSWNSVRKLIFNGCLSTEEKIGRGRCSNVESPNSQLGNKDLMSEGRGSLVLSSRESFRRITRDLSNYRNNVDSSLVSTHLASDQRKIVTSTHLDDSRSQLACSSSFHNFFLGETTPKACGDTSANSESFMEPTDKYTRTSTLTNQSSDNQAYASSVTREGLDLNPHGINLREWLVSTTSDVSKNDQLCLFKQIVQLVDDAHSQGIALLELMPSSFILFKSGHVKYNASFLEVELLNANHSNKKRRGLEHEAFTRNKSVRFEAGSNSKLVNDDSRNQSETSTNDFQNSFHLKCNPQKAASSVKFWQTFESTQLEKKWYACSEKYDARALISFNIYCLGLVLFEFLCRFESMEAHSAAMFDLHHRILPPSFLSEYPKEAGFCFWLLHPEPSCRPTTRDILKLELLDGYEIINASNDETSYAEIVDDAESDLLLHFLVSLKQHMQNKISNLSRSIEFLNEDIEEVEKWYVYHKSRDTSNKCYVLPQKPNPNPHKSTLKDKLLGNINKLEDAYFCLKSPVQLNKTPDLDRSDKDVLWNRDGWFSDQTRQDMPGTHVKSIDRVRTFFDGICKFACYNKFEVCGTLRNGDILNTNNVICSLAFDREEEYIAAAGVSKKIKIFGLGSLLNDHIDVQYPVLEMSNESKLSCISWNNYIKNYLVSSDYDGLVQLWDTTTGQGIAKYREHQRRAWSVDFSQVDPTKFISGGDDCSIRIWNVNERNSVGTIWNPANICCVQFSAFSSHLLAFGSADYHIYCYDLRHTKIPWCTLAGHKNAVSYVRHLDSETLVTASTDNTLKLWDLKKTSLEGLSSNSCCLTFTGHTNVKNFVGLAVMDGYIVCGSETNEVYAYYRSLPMPVTCHKFEYVEPLSGHKVDGNGHFVSSICWRKKSKMIAAANSGGSLKILRLV